MLDALGIGAELELLYRALVAQPSASAVQLAEAIDATEAEVDKALYELVEWGLAVQTHEGDYAAAPPAMALGALIAKRRDGLRLAEQALVTLSEQHRATSAGRSIGELIEVVTGVDAIRHRYLQVQHAAQDQIRSFVTAPFVAVPPGANSAEPDAVDRGVAYKCVLERAVLSEPGAIAEAIDSLRRGLQIRVVEHLPMKLVLADAELALVPLTVGPGAEPGAVLLHQSGLLAALDALFELVWRNAFPLELAVLGAGAPEMVELASDAPTALDRNILSLLLAGLTDQAVAAQLNLSLRTLQRRLRHLMDLAGVETRMQLGWYASQHHWS
jgi:predicted transcriptional regulator